MGLLYIKFAQGEQQALKQRKYRMGKDKFKKSLPQKEDLQYELTCVCCPVGCRLSGAFAPSEKAKISEQTCPAGWSYTAQEQRVRTRMVTALLPVSNGTVPLRVRSSRPVRRENIYQILKELSQITASVPVYEGEIIVKNICGLEVDIVAAEEYY